MESVQVLFFALQILSAEQNPHLDHRIAKMVQSSSYIPTQHVFKLEQPQQSVWTFQPNP
jgi:hypothetical protein